MLSDLCTEPLHYIFEKSYYFWTTSINNKFINAKSHPSLYSMERPYSVLSPHFQSILDTP